MHIDFLLIGKTGKKIVDNGSGYTHRSNKFLVRQSHSLKYAEIIYYLSNILIVRLCRYRDMHTFSSQVKTTTKIKFIFLRFTIYRQGRLNNWFMWDNTHGTPNQINPNRIFYFVSKNFLYRFWIGVETLLNIEKMIPHPIGKMVCFARVYKSKWWEIFFKSKL